MEISSRLAISWHRRRVSHAGTRRDVLRSNVQWRKRERKSERGRASERRGKGKERMELNVFES